MKRFAGLILLTAGTLCAQTHPKNTYHSTGAAAASRVVSPEIHPDRTVTFRLKAPEASTVVLNLAGAKPLTKGSDGIWSVTTAPLEPEIYTYTFTVDGVRILDPGNAHLKNGRTIDASELEIPGSPARFDEYRTNIPHGALGIRTYYSTAQKVNRRLFVYTPPQYDTEPARRFPVLYLRHGSGDNEENWAITGRAGVILDNLIAEHKAVPMIIVMPNGDTDGSWTGGSSPEGIETLSKEQISDILPLIESNYRVLPGRENRAITGLSMGGGQAFTIGLRHMDLFAWVGEFSSGLVSDTDFNLPKYLPDFFDNANKQLKLLYLSCGTADPRINGQLDLVDQLKAHNIRYTWFPTPGQHEWKVWRHALADFSTKVFQEQVPPAPTTLKSPEVLSDNRVTFRLYAPKATNVTVSGDWVAQGRGVAGKLAKDDNGIWSATVGPLVPDFYNYSFNVDGLSIVDPRNPMIKQGDSSVNSMFLVDGSEAAYETTQPVAHGQVHIDWYQSKVLDTMRSMHVYTPPGYDLGKEKLPVLYLLHGGGDEDSGWSTIGRAGFILDNLIAAKKAKPMIIVMPNGSMPRPNFTPGAPQTPAAQAAQREAQQKFVRELLDNVMPVAEKNYRIKQTADSRAIAGLSMGAGQTLAVAPTNLDKFAWIGVWSGGVNPNAEAAFMERNASFFADAAKTNKSVKLLWVAAGKNDTLAGPGTKHLAEILDNKGIKHEYHESEGGHTWINWRHYLNDYAQLLFR